MGPSTGHYFSDYSDWFLSPGAIKLSILPRMKRKLPVNGEIGEIGIGGTPITISKAGVGTDAGNGFGALAFYFGTTHNERLAQRSPKRWCCGVNLAAMNPVRYQGKKSRSRNTFRFTDCE